MFRVFATSPGGARLVADRVLSAKEFGVIARAAGNSPFTARKSGLVASRTCVARERVETLWNGSETVNIAEPGDHIVTNLNSNGQPLLDQAGQRNEYVIAAAKFPELYEPAQMAGESAVYRALGTVQVVAFPGGFEIRAPWGEIQRASSGYLICNGTDVYGNHAETFDATYERMPSA